MPSTETRYLYLLRLHAITVYQNRTERKYTKGRRNLRAGLVEVILLSVGSPREPELGYLLETIAYIANWNA